VLPGAGARRIATGGLGVLALALAALRAGGGAGGLPGDFAAAELGLVLVGVVALGRAAFPALRDGWRGVAGAALLAAGLALLSADVRALARAARPGATAAAFGVIVGLTALARLALGGLLRRLPPAADPRGEPVAARWVGCAASGALLAALGPHLVAVLFGVVLAAAAVAGATRGRRRFTAGLAGAGALVALAAAGWLFATIAGDQSLATAALPGLPLSPAAEALLAPLLLLAAWSVAGLWPMVRSPLSGLAGLAGLFLIARVAAPALPEGVDHWRPLAYPLLAVGLWQAIVARRWAAASTGGALFALISGTTQGVLAGWWLGAGALAAGLAELLPGRVGARVWWLAAFAGGMGALPGATAGLQREVVYTTLTVLGLAVLLAGDQVPKSPR